MKCLRGKLPHGVTSNQLCPFNCLEEDRQRALVLDGFHAQPSQWQAVHQYSCFVRLHERRPRANTHRGTARQQNLLQL